MGEGMEATTWTPVMYRSDGAWIGILPDGRLGVGVELEARASLVGSGFIPMWPYLGRDFSATLTEFTLAWAQLGHGGVSTPERLLELTVESAWRSGRSYWMWSALPWALDILGHEGFDQGAVQGLLRAMAASDDVPQDCETALAAAVKGLDDDGDGALRHADDRAPV